MKLAKKSGLSFFGLTVLVMTVTFVLLNYSNPNLAYSGVSTDPLNIPVPEFDFDDPARAMVVNVYFNSQSNVAFESAHVSSVRAPAHIGNPSILMIQTYDADGILLAEFNSWHPLVIEQENEDGTNSIITLDRGPGKFIVPFEPTLDSLMIVDVEQNEELLFVELAEPIRDFCQDNPDHPDCLEADLVLNDVSVTDSPGFVLVGESSDVTIQTVMENKGPSSPLDTIFSQTVTFPSEVLVSPFEIIEEETSLSDEDRTNDNTYSVQCLEPGNHTLVITSTIDAEQAAVSDPDLLNNETVIEHVVDCAIPILVDIKPGSDQNSINTRSMGVVPVAILGSESFDVTQIDVTTLAFGQGGEAPTHDLSNPDTYDEHLKDVNDDGFLDLVSHYKQKETGIMCGDTEATITVALLDGTPIEGTDSVNPKGC